MKSEKYLRTPSQKASALTVAEVPNEKTEVVTGTFGVHPDDDGRDDADRATAATAQSPVDVSVVIRRDRDEVSACCDYLEGHDVVGCHVIEAG